MLRKTGYKWSILAMSMATYLAGMEHSESEKVDLSDLDAIAYKTYPTPYKRARKQLLFNETSTEQNDNFQPRPPKKVCEESDHAELITLFFNAIFMNEDEAVENLLAHSPALIAAENSEGDTPLHWAIKTQASNIITEILLIHGASLQDRDQAGKTALELADQETMFLFLFHFIAMTSASRSPAPKKPDTETIDNEAYTRMIEEIQNLVKQILGTNRNLVWHFNKDRNTPLHWAILQDADISIIELLLENGAPLELCNRANQTPLLLAHMYQNERAESLISDCLKNQKAPIIDNKIDNKKDSLSCQESDLEEEEY